MRCSLTSIVAILAAFASVVSASQDFSKSCSNITISPRLSENFQDVILSAVCKKSNGKTAGVTKLSLNSCILNANANLFCLPGSVSLLFFCCIPEADSRTGSHGGAFNSCSRCELATDISASELLCHNCKSINSGNQPTFFDLGMCQRDVHLSSS
jgi:hypothetical protein